MEQLDDLTLHRRPLKRGEFLHHAGSALYSLYLIRTGSVKSRIAHTDGREQIPGFAFPGDMIGARGDRRSHASMRRDRAGGQHRLRNPL